MSFELLTRYNKRTDTSVAAEMLYNRIYENIQKKMTVYKNI